MSDNQLAVDVVRGEMQPWSDYDGKRGAVQGPVLRALLDDVLPSGARTLIVGPHSADLIDVVVARSAKATMLVRSVSDANSLAERFGDDLQVIAGALDGMEPAAFEVVVAADGLDRVLGYDSDDLNWSARLDALAAVASPAAVVVLGLENEFSLTKLLDRRLPQDRHADDDWRPLHDDPTRPVSTGQLLAELSRVGFADAHAYAAFSAQDTVLTLLAADTAAATRPGELPARLALEALETAAVAVPLLAPIAEGATAAARAGLLASTAPSWLAITTTPAHHPVYAQASGHTTVLTADTAAAGWSITTDQLGLGAAAGDEAGFAAARAASGDASAAAAPVVFDLGAVPGSVPSGITVETQLLRLAAAEDVPGFRALAARLGEWARAQDSARLVLRWDDVVVDGDGFAAGVSPWVTAGGESAADVLAAAWWRFHDRLIGGHRRHPWPPWMVGDDLVSAWLGMSGVEAPAPVSATKPETTPASAAQVARGRELAEALASALGIPADASQTPDVRTALADAERAQQEVFELKGQIFGLERTLGFRDKALKTRENRLREMRLQVQKVNAERAKLHGSRAFAAVTVVRNVATIRNPREFAGKLKRRLKRILRNRLG
ncbi:hypothetical protein EV644_107164 [Kribbella orskensis]|uniref:Uncharacterized protein n=1 Tax=Kribbella orskensis TaxID=2512216 RepID=A0ABY2BIT8_9ACTN|nr:MULTISPECIES: hypothetical protein [Kribbella]TCN39195.1 hypothetical protein EV642_107164 [Kribbella sp. VKM Ac-2500]TCO21842.1 hypothetical protein EV644_107164 [Kribbella orskensis]